MADTRPQTLANHGRLDPYYHFVLVALLLTVLYGACVMVYRLHDLLSFTMLAVALALIVMGYKTRTYPLKVQDRVIRWKSGSA